MSALVRSATLLAVFAALGAAGCEDAPATAPAAAPAAAGRARPGATGATPGRTGPGQAVNADAGGPPPMPVTDQSFLESPTVRDPFRRFSNRIDPFSTTDSRSVVLPRYTLDELHLVAVVLGTDSPYAMVKDPSNAGTILRRGMYVGRQEVIRSNIEGRPDYAVHWRVARINPARLHRVPDGSLTEVPAEVIFEREDPLALNAQVMERSVAMSSVGVATSQSSSTTPAVGSALGMPIPGIGGPAPTFLPNGVPSASAPGQSRVTTQVGPNGQTTTNTTVVVQAPPSSAPSGPQAAPIPTTPPPVRVTGDESPLGH